MMRARWLIRSLAFQIILALIFGSFAGFFFGLRTAPLGEVGTFVVKVLKFLAVPLVFFAIVDAFCKTEIPARKGLKLFGLSTMNACAALLISLGVSYGLPLRNWVDFKSLSLALTTESLPGATHNPLPLSHPPELTLKNFLQTFVPPNILGVVLLAIILGIIFRKWQNTRIQMYVEEGLKIVSKLMTLIVHVLPLAVFAIIAKVVGASGFKIFSALGVFVFVVTLGLCVHVFVYYSLLLIFLVRKSPRVFFSQASEPLITAFSIGSSLATLPVTLKTLREKMKITESSSRLAACVGTNLNHDGILLYEAVAALFIAQVLSVPLSLHQQVTLALTSVLAAVGIAGVPDAGFITLSLVLGAVGLPLAAVPLLLPVDWFIGRLRAATNVSSDMIVATLLDK